MPSIEDLEKQNQELKKEIATIKEMVMAGRQQIPVPPTQTRPTSLAPQPQVASEVVHPSPGLIIFGILLSLWAGALWIFAHDFNFFLFVLGIIFIFQGFRSQTSISTVQSAPLQKAVATKPNSLGLAFLGIVLILVSIGAIFSPFGYILGLMAFIMGMLFIFQGSRPVGIDPDQAQNDNSFEMNTAIKWFGRIGIIALVVGMGFFIKYGSEIISPMARIGLVIFFGALMAIGGSATHRTEKYKQWWEILSGGGFSIIYFAVYAAYHFSEYQIALGISRGLDIFLLLVVVLLAIIVSVIQDSQTIAAGAFFLGYLTSFFSGKADVVTLVYNSLLALGIVAVVAKKKWIVIGMSGLSATYLLYYWWVAGNGAVEYGSILSLVFLCIYFLAFNFQALAVSFSENKEDRQTNLAIPILNSFAFFGLAYWQFPQYHAIMPFVLSCFYFLMYFLSQSFRKKEFSSMFLYLSIFYITIFIPIQFNKEFITIFWALESLLLMTAYLRYKSQTLLQSGYVVGFITFFKAFFVDMGMHPLDTVNVLASTRFFSFLITIICFYIISRLLSNYGQDISRSDQAHIVYSWGATILSCLIILVEFNIWPQVPSILLSLLSLVLLVISGLKKKDLACQAMAISVFVFAKLIVYDSMMLASFESFIFVILCFFLAANYCDRQQEKIDIGSKKATMADLYTWAGSIATFVYISLEAKSFWISIYWMALAIILMTIGIMAKRRHFRLQGIVIFIITILKVFLYDTRELDPFFRTVSFMILGAVLLLVSFLYTKNKDKIKDLF